MAALFQGLCPSKPFFLSSFTFAVNSDFEGYGKLELAILVAILGVIKLNIIQITKLLTKYNLC